MGKMSEDRQLLWLDLETTGSSADLDEIIEVGCLMTNSELIVNDSFSEHSWTVICSDAALIRLLRSEAVREMHKANGLLDEVASNRGAAINVVEDELLGWLYAVERKERQVMLAGSGVGHFDRRMISYHMKKLDKYLHYAPFDIGNIRRAFQAWGIPLPPSGQKDIKTHRALDDAKLHLDEARSYMELFRGHLRFEAGHKDDEGSIATFPSWLNTGP
jgi:oligoribonuclease